MKCCSRLFLASLLALLAGGSPLVMAQGGGPDQATLQKWREAKLAEPWLKKAAWFTDYDQARQAARDGRKLILTYFTRSYAP